MIVSFFSFLCFCQSVLSQGEPCGEWNIHRVRIFVSSDNDCHFDGAEITEATIDSWPSKCERVCGNLFLTSNLSQFKLNSTFKNLIYLNGELHIQNTNISDTSFFKKLRMYYCGKGELSRWSGKFFREFRWHHHFKQWKAQRNRFHEHNVCFRLPSLSSTRCK